MASIRVIGRSVLGDLGLSQSTSTMGEKYYEQLWRLICELPAQNDVICTSMTGFAEVQATQSKYFPKVRLYDAALNSMFDPIEIYNNCLNGLDPFRPGCDFIIWEDPKITAFTFSREAPVLAFESCTGKKALGVILRPSLMAFGDYLFSAIKTALSGYIKVTLVTCNHFNYAEGSIPSIVQSLADKYDMECIIGVNSENDPECYHRGEKGNHVVAMW